MGEQPLRVALLIRSLMRGGAERQFADLAVGLRDRGHDVRVITFYPGGVFERELNEAGLAPVTSGKRSRWDVVRFGVRCATALRAHRPDVVYAFLPEANIVTALLRPWLGTARIVWGVRASVLEAADLGRFARMVARASVALSRIPAAVIANSAAAADSHVAAGYPAATMHVVENGIDTTRFHPDTAAGARMRDAWSVPAGVRLIGFPARLDPIKHHHIFFSLASRLLQIRRDVHFVCIGGGPATYRDTLESQVRAAGLETHMTFTGEVEDMNAAYNALSLCVSTSSSEGFPNVLGEAMAAGIACVATDAGDSGRILGEFGRVVPIDDVDALVIACERGLECQPDAARIRAQVIHRFSVSAMIERTLAVLAPPRASAAGIQATSPHRATTLG